MARWTSNGKVVRVNLLCAIIRDIWRSWEFLLFYKKYYGGFRIPLLDCMIDMLYIYSGNTVKYELFKLYFR